MSQEENDSAVQATLCSGGWKAEPDGKYRKVVAATPRLLTILRNNQLAKAFRADVQRHDDGLLLTMDKNDYSNFIAPFLINDDEAIATLKHTKWRTVRRGPDKTKIYARFLNEEELQQAHIAVSHLADKTAPEDYYCIEKIQPPNDQTYRTLGIGGDALLTLLADYGVNFPSSSDFRSRER